MRKLSPSRMRAYLDCPRKHWLRYEEGWRLVADPDALRVGSIWHEALELWWSIVRVGRPSLSPVEALFASSMESHELSMWQSIMLCYHMKWCKFLAAHDVEVLEIERRFEMPLVNPETLRQSKTWSFVGIMDLILKVDGEIVVVEHKTSSEDISGGSQYWNRLSMDHQASAYVLGARSIGYDVTSVLYDVVKKPGIRPFTATPPEKRKYTKTGELYANMRAVDETPSEFAARVYNLMCNDLDSWFAIEVIPRTDEQIYEFASDAWAAAKSMYSDVLRGQSTRNPHACHRFGSCEYWEHCSMGAPLDQDARFRNVNVKETADDAA